MEAAFKIWETSRKHCLSFFDTYSLEALNKIPQGFSNNLIWNIGHTIVAQQALVYMCSGLPGYVSKELFAKYKPGSKPVTTTSQDEVDELKDLLFSLIDTTKKDYYEGKFVQFNERVTATGFHLASLRDAIEFNNYHEGLHFGLMMNIKKFV